jgi:hypothetical protein
MKFKIVYGNNSSLHFSEYLGIDLFCSKKAAEKYFFKYVGMKFKIVHNYDRDGHWRRLTNKNFCSVKAANKHMIKRRSFINALRDHGYIVEIRRAERIDN